MQYIGGNSLVVKEVNINLVRKALKGKGQVTKQQLAEETGLSLVTIGTVLQQLIKENEVFEAELSLSRGGRPAQKFKYNDDFSQALVLFPYEAGENIMVHCCIVNLAGEIVYETDKKVESIQLKTFEHIINSLIKKYPSISAIGLGLPSVEAEGKIIVSDYKSLIGISIAEYFSDIYNIPVTMENDVNAAVMGFAKRKETDDHCTIVYLYFPDQHAPGAGIFINGKVHKGKGNFAGEVAALPLGIAWGPALYHSFSELCEAIVKLIVTMACILNPDYIVLNGSYLGGLHIKTIKTITETCSNQIPRNMIPEISISKNFIADYQSGMIVRTLQLLEPEIALTRK